MLHLDHVHKLGIKLLDKEIDNVEYLSTFSPPEIFY